MRQLRVALNDRIGIINLNALELLLQIGKECDLNGNFMLCGKYTGSYCPDYLSNGRAVLVELKAFTNYPNYTEELISRELDFNTIYRYKLEGKLTEEGMILYKKVVESFMSALE